MKCTCTFREVISRLHGPNDYLVYFAILAKYFQFWVGHLTLKTTMAGSAQGVKVLFSGVGYRRPSRPRTDTRPRLRAETGSQSDDALLLPGAPSPLACESLLPGRSLSCSLWHGSSSWDLLQTPTTLPQHLCEIPISDSGNRFFSAIHLPPILPLVPESIRLLRHHSLRSKHPSIGCVSRIQHQVDWHDQEVTRPASAVTPIRPTARPPHLPRRRQPVPTAVKTLAPGCLGRASYPPSERTESGELGPRLRPTVRTSLLSFPKTGQTLFSLGHIHTDAPSSGEEARQRAAAGQGNRR